MCGGKYVKLIIGGFAQGKLHYVLQKYGFENCVVLDADILDELYDKKENSKSEKIIVINHLHQWVRQCLIDRKNPEQLVQDFLEKNLDCIIISDEIGNGIVPIDAFEREYRERTGRILIKLAENAQEVERVICGIGQKIK